MKINIDAAISKNSIVSIMAGLVRGKFMAASTLVMEGLYNAETMEAIACREGLALASNLVVLVFRMTTDCANVMRSINGQGMGTYVIITLKFQARKGSFTMLRLFIKGGIPMWTLIVYKGGIY